MDRNCVELLKRCTEVDCSTWGWLLGLERDLGRDLERALLHFRSRPPQIFWALGS